MGVDVFEFHADKYRCERCGMRGWCIGYCSDGARPGCDSAQGRQRVQHAGSHLFRVGDPFQSLYVVRSGSVKTYLTSEDGEEQILGFHQPGDIVGFDAISRGRHPCSAAALETSSVCTLSFQKLTKVCQDSPQLLARLVQMMSRETLRLTDSLLLGRRSAEQRVATFLLVQAERQAERGYSPTALTLAMSRTDIGKYLGLTVETVSRILTRFQDLGLLAKERNQVRINDLGALRQVTGEIDAHTFDEPAGKNDAAQTA
jgi:CRP/FNR family transcriptional regulator, anaerobic regulatory protein